MAEVDWIIASMRSRAEEYGVSHSTIEAETSECRCEDSELFDND